MSITQILWNHFACLLNAYVFYEVFLYHSHFQSSWELWRGLHMPFGWQRMNKQSGLCEISRSGQLILSFYPLRSTYALGNPISISQMLVPDVICKHRVRRKKGENYFMVPLQSPLFGSSKYNEHKLSCETCLSKINANLFKNN